MDRVHPEPLGLGCPLFADEFVGRQTVLLQAAVQRRARQMRDSRLQRVEAVVHGMPVKGGDRRLILNGQNGGARLPGPC